MSLSDDLARVRIDASGALTINDAPFPTIDWTLCAPRDSGGLPILTASLPVMDVSDSGELQVRLLYVADMKAPWASPESPECTGATPQEALRALADALDARSGEHDGEGSP